MIRPLPLLAPTKPEGVLLEEFHQKLTHDSPIQVEAVKHLAVDLRLDENSRHPVISHDPSGRNRNAVNGR